MINIEDNTSLLSILNSQHKRLEILEDQNNQRVREIAKLRTTINKNKQYTVNLKKKIKAIEGPLDIITIGGIDEN